MFLHNAARLVIQASPVTQRYTRVSFFETCGMLMRSRQYQQQNPFPSCGILMPRLMSSTSFSETGRNIDLAKSALVDSDCVCFDVDSTVISEEGIDVLASFLNKGSEVAALTAQAMEGGMKFQDALKLRLDLLRPSRHDIMACLSAHPFQLTPKVHELIQLLHSSGKHVYLVSGGFRFMIEPIAKQVGVTASRIIANTILFDDNSNYLGFDTNEPTSRDMGKSLALHQIQQKNQYHCMIMIGDGFTDSQAKPPASAFIGFGGVVVRPNVVQAADWFVSDFSELIHVLEATKSL